MLLKTRPFIDVIKWVKQILELQSRVVCTSLCLLKHVIWLHSMISVSLYKHVADSEYRGIAEHPCVLSRVCF